MTGSTPAEIAARCPNRLNHSDRPQSPKTHRVIVCQACGLEVIWKPRLKNVDNRGPR